jgi:hypothetical protein
MLNWNQFEKLNENLSRARSILRGINVPESDTDFQNLRRILQNNTGYLGKFTEWLYVQKVPLARLEALLKTLREERVSVPIDQFKTPEEVIDFVSRSNSDQSVNQMIRAIPSRVREYFDDEGVMDNLKEFLKSVVKEKEKIIKFFSRKGGTLNDLMDNEGFEQVIEDIRKIAEFKTYEEISEFSKTENSELQFIFEDERILVVGVKSFEGIQKWGSSYWCITQDKYTYKDYVSGSSVQLIVYYKDKEPFSERSMLGMTIHGPYRSRDNISAAHWEDDSSANREAGRIFSAIKRDENFKKGILKSIDINNIISDLENGNSDFNDLFDLSYEVNSEKLNLKLIDCIGDHFSNYGEFTDGSIKFIERIIDKIRFDKDNLGILLAAILEGAKLNLEKICTEILEDFSNLTNRKKSDFRKEIFDILNSYDLSTDDSDLTRNKNNTNVKLLLSTFWSLIKDTRAYQSASEIRTLFFNFGIIDIEGFVDNLDDINFEIVEESQQKKIIDWCIKNSKIPKNKDIFEGILGESDPTFIRQNQKYISELLKSYRVEGRLLVKIIQSVDDSESEAIARRMIKIPSEILRFYDIDIRKKSK